jgi:hypothetical protein
LREGTSRVWRATGPGAARRGSLRGCPSCGSWAACPRSSFAHYEQGACVSSEESAGPDSCCAPVATIVPDEHSTTTTSTACIPSGFARSVQGNRHGVIWMNFQKEAADLRRRVLQPGTLKALADFSRRRVTSGGHGGLGGRGSAIGGPDRALP